MLTLSSRTLSALPTSLATPSYDRSNLKAGIVHFGVRGFHRAHQAMYLDRLMNAGLARDWAIVGVLPADAHMKQVMDSQDCLYNPHSQKPGRQQGKPSDRLNHRLPLRTGRP